jgi:hypothetical protein
MAKDDLEFLMLAVDELEGQITVYRILLGRWSVVAHESPNSRHYHHYHRHIRRRRHV